MKEETNNNVTRNFYDQLTASALEKHFYALFFSVPWTATHTKSAPVNAFGKLQNTTAIPTYAKHQR